MSDLGLADRFSEPALERRPRTHLARAVGAFRVMRAELAELGPIRVGEKSREIDLGGLRAPHR
jgi:hypothetical protein